MSLAGPRPDPGFGSALTKGGLRCGKPVAAASERRRPGRPRACRRRRPAPEGQRGSAPVRRLTTRPAPFGLRYWRIEDPALAAFRRRYEDSFGFRRALGSHVPDRSLES